MELPGSRPVSAARRGVVALLCAVAVTGQAAAAGSSQAPAKDATPAWTSQGLGTSAQALLGLPAARENVELISQLELATPDTYKLATTEPDLLSGQIADLSIHKNAAYLASRDQSPCRRGGFFSVDISDPRNPRQLAFVPALPATSHGEGTHAITLDTPSFQGDVLAVNNVRCGVGGVGGFDLYDVSDPASPKPLVQGAGDRSPDRARNEARASTVQDPAQIANSTRSIFLWKDGAKAYAVVADDDEFADLDIFDVTDPRRPVFIVDLDPVELAFDQGVAIAGASKDALGAGVGGLFLHDAIVRRVNDVPVILASYGDAGYVELDVSDLAAPRIIGHAARGEQDPLFDIPRTDRGWPPGGTAHQAEFSADGRYVLAADEDLSPHRLLGQVDTGAEELFNFFAVGEPDPGPKVTVGRPIDGDSRFVGDGCVAATIPVATPEVPVAIVERGGGCGFQAKVQNADARGYDGVIIFNAAVPDCEVTQVMTFPNYTGDALSALVARSVGLRMIGALGSGDPCAQVTPAAPREANEVFVGRGFDGWGYLHLYDAAGDDLTAVDHFAIEEATDERFATGFGDLGVHEVATDPTENLVYSSYHAGGLRVLSFGPNGLDEVGKFVAEGGNDLWGVEIFDHASDGRLIAASDRDFGLRLFRYAGRERPSRPAARTSTPPPRPGARSRSRSPVRTPTATPSGSRWPRSRGAARSAASPGTPWSTPPPRASPARTPSRSRPTTGR